jgi:carboxyl-terminal processing protease
MPDYFVPVDTTKYTKYHRTLAARGSIIQASLHYLDEHRAELVSKYKNIDEFEKKFEVDETYMQLLRDQGVKDSVKLEGGEEEFQRSLPELKVQLKQYIARDLWDMGEFIRIYNKTNDLFIKAYDILRQKDFDKLLLKEKK